MIVGLINNIVIIIAIIAIIINNAYQQKACRR